MKLSRFILFLALIINLCQCNDSINNTEYSQDERIRRDLSGISNKFTDFVIDELTQHSKELEFIIKAVYKSEGLIKKLLGKFDLGGLRSKFLGSIDNRRRSNSYETNSDTEAFYTRNVEEDRPHRRHQRNVVSGVDLSKFVEFVEEKLMQHSSALEFIIKSVKNSEGLLKKIERFDLSSLESKLFNADDSNDRRTENDHDQNKRSERLEARSPFEQLAKFGNMARRMIENEFGPDDPIPIEETEKEERSEETPVSVEATTIKTKSSFKSAPLLKESPQNDQTQTTPIVLQKKDTVITRKIGNFTPSPALVNDQNPWCATAATCQSDRIKVCGYDANYTYGVGQFEDACHMFKYNCQSNYNFKVTPCDKATQNGVGSKH